jgi:hypothetical protein
MTVKQLMSSGYIPQCEIPKAFRTCKVMSTICTPYTCLKIIYVNPRLIKHEGNNETFLEV